MTRTIKLLISNYPYSTANKEVEELATIVTGNPTEHITLFRFVGSGKLAVLYYNAAAEIWKLFTMPKVSLCTLLGEHTWDTDAIKEFCNTVRSYGRLCHNTKRL